ncbi:MAG TPA: hypothetical protein DEO54_09040 [Rikenellaceae bacterium]|jgi:hypothetical protein|nr:MAG: hypothetical protein A2X20_04200 [Bacteroidetes bacterium GWE2_40_15]PKP07585.1 MAG: hypothetical protein CVU10_08645 [Bacteroidetes bacterium HGW-Bacteroidetes-5]HBZ26358.1 hypothetical protein [Rikenellaceae bacterium]
MKKILYLALLLSFTFSGADAQINPNVKPAPTEAKPIRIGEFHSFVADNNMRVFLIRKSGYPKFRITVEFGVPLIPLEKEPEVRRVLADIFSKGSSRFSAVQIKDKADLYAASVTGFINSVTCSGMKSQIDTLFPMMTSYVTSPGINEESVKSAVEEGLKKLSDNGSASKLTKSTFLARLQDSLNFYINTTPPKVEETLEGFTGITTESVQGYFNKYINPDNSFCILSGDFTIEEANAIIVKHFKGWRGGARNITDFTSSYSKNFPTSTKIYVIDNPNAVQSRISVRWPLGDAFPYGENEALLMVMNQIYGAGYMSNLNQNIRVDKGLSYGANNILVINITGGQCSSNTLVRNSETAYALENIFLEMLKMRNETVTQQKLDMAKNGLTGDYARSMSQLNSPAIIGFGMVKEKFNLPDNYLTTYPLKIAAVTAEDIRAAAQKYIKPYESIVIIEGKVADIKGTLEKFAPVEYYTQEGVRIH